MRRLDQARRAYYTFRELRAVPPTVPWYLFRARELAIRRADDWALESATSLRSVRALLRLADSASHVVELGSAIGWTAGALVLAQRNRRVMSYDIEHKAGRDEYLALLPASARARIALIRQPGNIGAINDDLVDLLFIDSSHNRIETVKEFKAWGPAIRPGGLIVFHDYRHPDFGVTAAIDEDLKLAGQHVMDMFVWRKPA